MASINIFHRRCPVHSSEIKVRPDARFYRFDDGVDIGNGPPFVTFVAFG